MSDATPSTDYRTIWQFFVDMGFTSEEAVDLTEFFIQTGALPASAQTRIEELQ